ncbi:MAG: DUF4224 domain-containing protein [Candidatus Thiodiazotropha taylori]
MLLVPLDDLKELTDCGQRRSMIRWLTDHGWKFEVGDSGWPKVALEEFNNRMVSTSKRSKAKREPRLILEAIK